MGDNDLTALAAAFATGAGFAANDMSMLIRGLVASSYMLWSCWIAYKQFILMAASNEESAFADFRMNMIRLVLGITLVLFLISI